MKPKNRHEVAISLRYENVPASRFSRLECWGCRTSLELHQPDEHRPEQILANCAQCGRWYLVASRVQDDQLTILELPDLTRIGLAGPASPPPPTA